MSNHRDDDLEPALRAMLGDHHLDIRPRSDAVGTVLAGVGRARRRRNTGYATVTTFAVAAAIGGIVLTGSDTPKGIEPIVPPTTSTPTETTPPTTEAPTVSITPPATSPPPPAADDFWLNQTMHIAWEDSEIVTFRDGQAVECSSDPTCAYSIKAVSTDSENVATLLVYNHGDDGFPLNQTILVMRVDDGGLVLGASSETPPIDPGRELCDVQLSRAASGDVTQTFTACPDPSNDGKVFWGLSGSLLRPVQLTTNGIGDIQLGQSPSQAYGTGTIGEWDGAAIDDVCSPGAHAVRTTPDHAMVWMDDELGVQMILIDDPGNETVDGIAIGMDLDEALALVPDVRAEVWGDPADDIFRYFVEDWLGSGNQLEIREDNASLRVVEAVMLRSPGGQDCIEPE